MKFINWFNEMFKDDEFYVYGMKAENNIWLYVGLTSKYNLHMRMREHWKTTWVREAVVAIDILGTYPNKETALQGEGHFISKLQPMFNKYKK